MKRIILFAALLVAVSACSTTPEANNANTTTTPANANTNANASPTPKAEATVKDSDITAKEQEIWDKIKAGDMEGFGGMLAEDFVFVGGEGISDKAGTVNGIKEFKPTEATFSDWKVVMLDKDSAVVTYTVNAKGTSGGKPIPPTPIRGSSVWVNRGGKWVGVYHQETEAKEPTPAPPASGKEAAKPAAGAEAKPEPITPEADHVAREKQVWDAIKKKNYEGFASFLAEDAIEVWDGGVNDKAASIEGVKKVDLSRAVLSDFKTVKLTDNAVLVIYMVKGPTPPFSKLGERDATIWATRGGKWLAVFHQGSSVKPAPKMK
ncbi:MAG TPA: nuclear transport factor 2 family protein [Pyrinomonadaceae bacterium]